MNLLLHACCAPCSTYSYEELSKENKVTLFWYDPNIHPYQEYKKRLNSFKEFVEKIGVEYIITDEYTLDDFLQGALSSKDRCEFCYSLRLEETAKITAKKGFDAFTTTLTISPYQNHELISQVGKAMGDKYGVEFIYKDLRDGFRKSHQMARDMELYLQGYCGCIFSEMERYKR